MKQNLMIHSAGFLILLFPTMLITVPDGGSVTLVLLLLVSATGLFLNRNSVPLDNNEKLLLAAVAAYMLIYIFNIWFFNSKISELDNTFRFLLLLPIFFYIRKIKLNPNYLYYGLLAGAVACFAIAAYQKFYLDYSRSHGVTSIISFGGISMTLAMMSFTMGLLSKTGYTKILFFSGFILATWASVLSGSRGTWLVLPSCLLLLFVINPQKWSLKTRVSAGLISLLMISASYFLPVVQHRVDTALNEMNAYITNNVANTSVGIRLDIWHASIVTSTKHPALGIGEGNFSNKMKLLSDQGLVDPYALNIAHVHNEYISALLHRGFPGLITLLLLFLIPLIAFSKALISEQGEHRILPAIGIMLVISSMTASLSDMFFSQHKYTLFYAGFIYLIYAFMRQRSTAPTRY
jgi:O-antigen ligase